MMNIFFIGPVPPPITGMALINFRLVSFFEDYGANTFLLNTSPSSLSRVKSLAGRILSAVICIKELFVRHDCEIVYISASGGVGIAYELMYIAISSYLGRIVFYHHHSYSYITRFSFLTLFLTRFFKNVVHVFLGREMASAFQQRYSSVDFRVICNSAFIPPYFDASLNDNRPVVDDVLVISFMSNLSSAKGLDEFLELAQNAYNTGKNWKFLLAGPFITNADYEKYSLLISRLPNLKYVGKVNDLEKKQFFIETHVFVFPTRYSNEASPLVLLEAMSYGCIPITVPRGMITSILPKGWPLIFELEIFVADSCKFLDNLTVDQYDNLRALIISHYSKMHDVQFKKLRSFVSHLKNALIQNTY